MRDTLIVIEYLADWAKDWKVYSCYRDEAEGLHAFARHVSLHPTEQCRVRYYEDASNGDVHNFNPHREEDS